MDTTQKSKIHKLKQATYIHVYHSAGENNSEKTKHNQGYIKTVSCLLCSTALLLQLGTLCLLLSSTVTLSLYLNLG